MIQRLIDSLEALAAPPDVQCARFAGVAVKADELVLDFDDAFLLIRDCPQMILTHPQQDALVDLDLALTAMSRSASPEVWTEDALRAHPDWKIVRRLAAAALEVLGRRSGDHREE